MKTASITFVVYALCALWIAAFCAIAIPAALLAWPFRRLSRRPLPEDICHICGQPDRLVLIRGSTITAARLCSKCLADFTARASVTARASIPAPAPPKRLLRSASLPIKTRFDTRAAAIILYALSLLWITFHFYLSWQRGDIPVAFRWNAAGLWNSFLGFYWFASLLTIVPALFSGRPTQLSTLNSLPRRSQAKAGQPS